MGVEAKMKCPDKNAILFFAEDPLHKYNADIASHIYMCPACGREFKLALEAVNCRADVSQSDIAAARKILGGKKEPERLSLWKKLKETVETLYADIFPADFFTPVLTPSMASSERGAGGDAEDFSRRREAAAIKIVFAAHEKATPNEFWRAELELPPTLLPSSKIAIKVTDRNGNAIESGTLILFNIPLAVRGGAAAITFEEFRAGMEIPVVKFIFDDRNTVDGNLIFV